MHNLFATTPVNNYFLLDTFRGQAVQSLWENRGEPVGLSTSGGTLSKSLWVNLGGFTRLANVDYTVFPTGIRACFPQFLGCFPTSSTGPIKRTTKYKKEFRS